MQSPLKVGQGRVEMLWEQSHMARKNIAGWVSLTEEGGVKALKNSHHHCTRILYDQLEATWDQRACVYIDFVTNKWVAKFSKDFPIDSSNRIEKISLVLGHYYYYYYYYYYSNHPWNESVTRAGWAIWGPETKAKICTLVYVHLYVFFWDIILKDIEKLKSRYIKIIF